MCGRSSLTAVVIADTMFSMGIKGYEYEKPLRGSDGGVRYPDFTVHDAEAGRASTGASRNDG
jgi:hypothetical protein